MATYYTVITNIGQQKIAAYLAGGPVVQLTHMAVGDGNGNPITPNATMTTLVREQYRHTINDLQVDAARPNTFLCELVIPAANGGWPIYEVGLFDSTGALIAVANFPGTYKPTIAEGATRDLLIWMYLQVATTSAVTLVVDPSLVVATRVWSNAQFLIANQIPGGTTHQILRKKTNTNGDFEWADLTEGVTILVDMIEERQTLTSGQTTVNLATVTTNGLAVYVGGARLPFEAGVDGWQKAAVPNDLTRIILGKSYPAGTRLIATQNEPAGSLISPLQAPNNLSDVQSVSTARTNLGLGSAATRAVGLASTNVMEVGAFGLGSVATALTAGDNMDNLVLTGFYTFSSTVPGTKPSGVTNGIVIHVQRQGTAYREQLVVADGTLNGSIWTRSHNGTTWGSWSQVWTTQNFNPATKLNVAGDTMTGNLSAPGITARTGLTVGSDGNGNSVISFYDDNSNVLRALYWDDAANDWRVQDNAGSVQKLWHSGNDGPGSGLDADLIDGIQGSQLARKDIDETFAGNLIVQGQNIYVGKDGGANSHIWFFDDNSNGFRALYWDDANNGFAVQDNGGASRTLVHTGNLFNYIEFVYGALGSRVVNGSQTLPGGLIIKWGTAFLVSVAGANITSGVTLFPSSFPNQCLGVGLMLINQTDGTSDFYATAWTTAWTTAGFFWNIRKLTNAGSWHAFWIAVGT